MSPKVSIIILNYNGKTHTLDCLASLSKVSFKDKEIILYDNGSKDDTAAVVKKRFKGVRVIHRDDNIGYCGGTNDAYRYAKGRYILFLNNDTLAAPDFLTKLVTRMEQNKKTAIVQPKLIFTKTGKLQSGCTYFTSTGFLYYVGYGKDPKSPKYNRPMQMHSVNGACMLVRRDVIEEIGLFDPDFFLYFEETDFCHRALLSGYTIWYEPKATIYHIGSVDNSRYKYSALIYSATRNRIRSYMKNLGTMSLIRVLPVHLVLCAASVFAYLFTGRPESSWSVLRALWYNVQHIKRTLIKRAYVQKRLRRLPDAEFLPQVTRNPRLEYYVRLFTGLEQYQE